MKKILCEMFGVRIVETPAINRMDERSIDDVNRQLSTARSIFKKPGRSDARHTPDTARMQADVDSATSVVKKEEATPQGITLSGDKETLGALMECLQEAEHAQGVDPDVASWAGRAWKAVAAGIRGNGSFNLPRFESTPDDLMPDDEGDEGERF